MTLHSNPMELTADHLRQALHPELVSLPELSAARANLAALCAAPQTQYLLTQTQHLMEHIDHIPLLRYTAARRFKTDGDRQEYETPYFHKRAALSAATLRLFLGQTDLQTVVQNYVWSLCEDTTWVVPASEPRAIDLFSAETGFLLAETVTLLGDMLDVEVRHRVRQEIERRIFTPYLHAHRLFDWYQRSSNWNGVCNSSVAATFLLLEPDPDRVAQAIEIALAGLNVYLERAFEPDGSSTEGISYWHYGLSNFVAFAEMLRARSNGAINLLDTPRMRLIASYPSKIRLSATSFATFSDCNEHPTFQAGVVARLAERTGETSLWDLLARPVKPRSDWRLPMQIRTMLWWDGNQAEASPPEDTILPASEIARLTGRAPDGAPIALVIKSGHNNEHHNQNDVGSFIVHVDGENLLTDPGRGLYTQAYFSPRRYENIFANSYGHSVPRIGGQLQGVGQNYAGALCDVVIGAKAETHKQAVVDFARAYPVDNLLTARRTLLLSTHGDDIGTIWLCDSFSFNPFLPAGAHAVEEALITWYDVSVEGAVALVFGQRHTLRLEIKQPEGAEFQLECLEEESKVNAKPNVLKRLSVTLAPKVELHVSIRMQIIAPRQ
ncbi:MAG: heparinase II/III-family protein [Chloroflexales bacterium]|nr:heparinase II/III-family protein [Chloroflexales bacterium]